jgi:hypothetical protein
VMSATPLRPAIKASQNAPILLPIGVTAPMPVMTTRRFSKTCGDTTMPGAFPPIAHRVLTLCGPDVPLHRVYHHLRTISEGALMIKQRLTRLAVAAAIAVGTVGATVAATIPAATPALAQDWHGGYQDRDHGGDHDRRPNGWRDRDGRWHQYGYGRPVYVSRGPRYYDRQHGYWRDNAGYWNPHSGLYVSFHL